MKRRNFVKLAAVANLIPAIAANAAATRPPILLSPVFGSSDFDLWEAGAGGGTYNLAPLPQMDAFISQFLSRDLKGANYWAPINSAVSPSSAPAGKSQQYDSCGHNMIIAKHFARHVNGNQSEDAKWDGFRDRYMDNLVKPYHQVHSGWNTTGSRTAPFTHYYGAQARRHDNFQSWYYRSIQGETAQKRADGREFLRRMAEEPSFAHKFWWRLDDPSSVYRPDKGGAVRALGYRFNAELYYAKSQNSWIRTDAPHGPLEIATIPYLMPYVEGLFERLIDYVHPPGVSAAQPTGYPETDRNAPWFVAITADALFNLEELASETGNDHLRWWSGNRWPTPMHALEEYLVDIVENATLHNHDRRDIIDVDGVQKTVDQMGLPLFIRGFARTSGPTETRGWWVMDRSAQRNDWTTFFYHNILSNEAPATPSPMLNMFVAAMYWRMALHIGKNYDGIGPQTGKPLAWFTDIADGLFNTYTYANPVGGGHDTYAGKAFGQMGMFTANGLRARKQLLAL